MPGEKTIGKSHSKRPRLAVFKFASCDGCQLQLLSCEDELLGLSEQVDIVHFLEGTSRVEAGPYDIALVEGSITTAADRQRIREVRDQSKFLMTIGACATSGGIQALKNWGDREEFLQCVYALPEFIDTLSKSTAIADHVAVDFELRGCPINRFQLLEVLRALLEGRKPRTPKHAVCFECKLNQTVCVAVVRDDACLGPITQAGCGAICPSFRRPCYGCFGPAAQTNTEGLVDSYRQGRCSPAELVPLLRNFNAEAADFKRVGDQLSRSEESRVKS